jgi:hypothetical protein
VASSAETSADGRRSSGGWLDHFGTWLCLWLRINHKIAYTNQGDVDMSRYAHELFRFVLCCLFALSCVGSVFAEDGEGLFAKLGMTASGAIDFYSKYIWRGFTLDRDPVVQPSFNMSYNGLTFSVWSYWDAVNEDGVYSDEMVFIVDYTKSLTSSACLSGILTMIFQGRTATAGNSMWALERRPFRSHNCLFPQLEVLSGLWIDRKRRRRRELSRARVGI